MTDTPPPARPVIHDRLAQTLREARKARGLSLEAAARLSGVSRSMVSQIERGESSPTVATLWNLTQALQVDFAGLLAGTEAEIELIPADAVPVIRDMGAGCAIRILSPPETVGRHEVYELRFQPGGRLDSGAHGPGSREHLTALEGRLRVRAGAAERIVTEGCVARYPADRPHAIAAEDGAARALLIVENG